MSIVKFALVLLVVVAGLVFHVRNDQLVVVDYYLANHEIPLSVALAMALLCGAILGVLSGLPSWLKLKRDKAKLSRQLRKYEPDPQDSADKSTDDTD